MKLLNKIVGAALGLTMAVGVGLGIIRSHQEPVVVHAAETTVTWAGTTALPETATTSSVVIIISLISITAIAGYVLIRKKKELN